MHRLLPGLLVVALATALVACRAEPSASATPTAQASAALTVSLADFAITPAGLTAAGPTINIAVTNAGPTPHNLSVRDAGGTVLLATAEQLSSGQNETISADLAAGEYVIFCALAGHESLGMRGSLTVRAP